MHTLLRMSGGEEDSGKQEGEIDHEQSFKTTAKFVNCGRNKEMGEDKVDEERQFEAHTRDENPLGFEVHLEYNLKFNSSKKVL